MKNIYVLDACALITLTNKEKGADIIVNIFNQVNNGNAQVIMNRINLYEVYYGFYREHGKEYALNVIENVERSPILITEFDKKIFIETGRLKALYKISLADSIVLAQAIISNGFILTSDHHEFDCIEGKENLNFIWTRY